MAGARAAAAAASAGASASSGNQPPQEPGLGELLEEFSRTQYRAKDGSGTGGSKSSYRQTWRVSCQLRPSPP
uniref:Myotubularin related protein 14 n=1 Tax=Nomascus leucogenys TaxID=61853 RepID=A0A2I3GHM9_NOMLE